MKASIKYKYSGKYVIILDVKVTGMAMTGVRHRQHDHDFPYLKEYTKDTIQVVTGQGPITLVNTAVMARESFNLKMFMVKTAIRKANKATLAQKKRIMAKLKRRRHANKAQSATSELKEVLSDMRKAEANFLRKFAALVRKNDRGL